MVATKVLVAFKEMVGKKKEPKIRILKDSSFDYTFSWSFFDGVSQGIPPCCGVGMILYVSPFYFNILKLGAREG